MKVEIFQEINGFSNLFYGWGGEDDDLYSRVRAHGYKILRSTKVSRYSMLKHKTAKAAPQRYLFRKKILFIMTLKSLIVKCLKN